MPHRASAGERPEDQERELAAVEVEGMPRPDRTAAADAERKGFANDAEDQPGEQAGDDTSRRDARALRREEEASAGSCRGDTRR